MHRDLKRDLEEHDFQGVDFYRGQVAFNLGKLEISRKDYDDAAVELTQAIGAMTRIVPESNEMVLTARAFLIEALEQEGRSDEATEHCIAIGRARTDREIADYMPIFRKQPIYPRSAAYGNIQGSVKLALTVTASGRTKDLKVMGGENVSYLEKAALDAARQFRYAPRIENGEPVDTPDVEYKFSFRLEN